MNYRKAMTKTVAVAVTVCLLGTSAMAEDLKLTTDQDKYSFGKVEVDIQEIPLQDESEDVSVPDIKKVAADTMPAIVAITNASVETISYFGRKYEMDGESSGSGIIVGKNETELLIATNNHVVENAKELTVCFSVDAEDPDDAMVTAKVKGTDSALDLAVIAVDLNDISEEIADNIGIIQMGSSDDLEVGEWVVAIGNALGYGQSVTFGIVSALDREVSLSTENGTISNDMIQTDAAINFGNSGGALLDTQGRLIGINSAKAASNGVEGMGYAIPIDTAKPIIEELMSQTTRSIVDSDKAAILGVIAVDVSEEARQMYYIPKGAYVYELTEGAAAEEAGIRKGDIIVKLDQTAITSQQELVQRLKYYEAGETVAVTVKRAGESGYEDMVIDVVLSKRSDFVDSSYDDEEEETELSDDDAYQGYDGYDEYDYYGRNGNDYYSDGMGDLYDLFNYFGFGMR